MNLLESPLYLWYFTHCLLRKKAFQHSRRIRHIRNKGKATVAFIVSTLPMWRGQGVYDLLVKDSRFEPTIVLLPFASYSEAEKETCLKQMHAYFLSLNIPIVDLSSKDNPGQYLRKDLNPDIVFYPQQYYSLYNNDVDSYMFEDRLLCFIPYSLNIISEPWIFNQRFNNVAWRLFYPTSSDLESGERYSFAQGRNIRVVGNPTADRFLSPTHPSVWKKQETNKKRIIWAPHFSINSGSLIHRGAFLSLYNDMLLIAERLQSQFQFAFKPHPRLATELYNHPEWGKEQTDAYYQKWADGTNTQLETGSFIDIFMNSDAMIHDSVSFSAEYHYTHNPVLFTSQDISQTKRQLNELGRQAIDAHYLGSGYDDILYFLNKVVLEGEDPLKERRLSFFEQYLRPPGGHTVAENIYQEIVSSIWG